MRPLAISFATATAALAALAAPAASPAAGTGADLQISGSAGGGAAIAGGPLSYTFQVRNAGPDTASGVTFSDVLPAGTTYAAAGTDIGRTCSAAAGVVSCDLGPMTKGGQATVTVNVTTPAAPASLSSTAKVASATPDPQPANNTATVTTQTKSSACPVPAGQTTVRGLVMAKYTDPATGFFENFTLDVDGTDYFVRTNFYDGSAPLTTVVNLLCKQSPVQFVGVANFVNVTGTIDAANGVINASLVQVMTVKDRA